MKPGRGPVLLLHVGAMKTGTTYVQHLLQNNRGVLGDAGWWVPEHKRVVQATRELLALDGVALGSSGSPHHGLGDAPRWTSLMDEVRGEASAPGRRGAVLSMEFLSFMVPAGVALLRESTTGLDLRVVLTVRDAARALPSQWQSLTRNGQDLSWPTFAAGARGGHQRPGPPGARAFRRTQDVPRMLRTWGGVVPPADLVVITAPRGPESSRDLLWSRLCSVLGVDPAATDATAFDNPQLGYGSCELMRLVNAAGMERGAPRSYRKVVRRLTKEHLLPLRGEQSRPRVDEATAVFAAALNARTLAETARLATLVGDPADLPVVMDPGDPHEPLDPGDTAALPPDGEVLRAATALHAGAVMLCAELGLDLPDDVRGPLPDRVAPAVEKVATVIGIAITGDITHRPRPRSG